MPNPSGPERRRVYDVDPVQFGQLVGKVDALTTAVGSLSTDVRSLLESRSTNKGILVGLAMVGGGVGAAAHKLMEGLLK